MGFLRDVANIILSVTFNKEWNPACGVALKQATTSQGPCVPHVDAERGPEFPVLVELWCVHV